MRALVLTTAAPNVAKDGYVRARGTLTRVDGDYAIEATHVEAIHRPGAQAAVLEKALDDPRTEVLETITVTAEVREVLAPQAFWIAGRGDDGVVVVSRHRPDVDERDVVQVTGTVRRFDPSVILSEADVVLRSDVAEEVRRRVEENVVFVAESMTLVNLDEH